MNTDARSVFILDDDAAVRESLVFTLELEGFGVRVFEDPRKLIEALRCSDASCLITNYNMPGLTGLQVVRQMRDRCPQLPIILMSGAVTPNLKARAMAAGASFVVDKPLLDDSLIDYLRQVCEGKGG